MLQNVMQRSWSFYAERSPSPSDYWENTLEEVQLEKEGEKQCGESADHMEHDGDCCDWGDDDTSLRSSSLTRKSSMITA
jgi:hypothetical protein